MKNLKNINLMDRVELKINGFIKKRLHETSKQVKWVSYHIPKTAGTSFRLSLESAYGARRVFGVYADSGAKEMSRAEQIWLPRSATVLHGHFKALPKHGVLFPNAKRLVWLRDPIQRSWSLLNHTLDISNNDNVYGFIKNKFIDKGISDREEIFLSLLSDKESKKFFHAYSLFFKTVGKDFFHFVGNSNDYDDELKRLSNLMGIRLTQNYLNESKVKRKAPEVPRALHKYFDDEYKVYNLFCKN
ncbi:MAG: hypothetical protein HWE26_13985 [Alteromonadaceae bacterium]|nr:hypothetical protein [Alteromonadaceae bacterium]